MLAIIFLLWYYIDSRKTKNNFLGVFIMENKNIISLTVSELWQAYESEAESLADIAKKDSNKRKQVNKCRFVQYLLDSMPENVVITVEGCWGDGVIRQGCLANAGSVVECIVKYHLHNTESVCKAWQESEHDTTQGCMPWEVKFSANCKFLATPSPKALTLLVNADGISLIKKAEVLGLVDKKGKLPCKGVYGNRNNPFLQRLAESMGMEDGWQE